jgi:hypothetical protein
VTVSEFLFLALGLILGVASGIALIEIIRARPPARREVRVTVSKDAIPRRRAPTLAEDAFVAAGPEPARGGPADRRSLEDPAPAGIGERRTNVPNDPLRAALATPHANLRPALVGMPVATGSDPMLDAIQSERPVARALSGATARQIAKALAAAEETARVGEERGAGTIGAVALMDPPAASASPPPPAPVYTGPCADERRLADERCEVASRAHAQATAAADALRRAQRAYDTHTSEAEAAAAEAHPLEVRRRKEDAQRAFRAASRAAGSPDAVEAAARTWLQDINRINREAAGASLVADRERAAANVVGGSLERLGREADAARVGADIAEAACVEARAAVADCDERQAAGTRVAKPAAKTVEEVDVAGDIVDDELGLALQGGSAPRIFRLLRGDPESMDALVASLGAGDEEDQRRWKLALAGLLDAILADAIEHGFLRFPHEHAFWGPYTQEQNREIARALSSLGYRFDGLGGWVDERIPSQRELSLALGYAGLDPMRVRHWPTEQETIELLHNVEVAADEYLAGAAGGLTLAEMVDLLGRRADGLVDLWNHWGRVRPLLLDEA